MTIVDILNTLQESANEKFAVFYHTSNGIFGHIMAEGDESNVTFNSQTLIEGAHRIGATKISFAHNHPTGPVRPSHGDLKATFLMQDLFKENGLKLHDHVIVGKEGSPFSMLANGVI